MSKLSEWVKSVRKGSCEECASTDSLKVIREGRTLCKLCYYRYHNKSRVRRVPGKPKDKPITPNSKRARLWAEIERLRSLIQGYTIPQTSGEEARNLHE